MRVTILAHSSVLIEMGTSRVLVDPIFDDAFGSDTLVFDPPRTLDMQALVETTSLIAVTHIHLDHFHPPTLARFPRDTPILVPQHDVLIAAVTALGFSRVIPLGPWSQHVTEGAILIATPSEFEIDEFGLIAVEGQNTYWHMSDAIVDESVGQRVKALVGPVSVASVKHQPLRTLIGYQRGLQATMLDRSDLIGAFEAACAAEPAFLFPYYSGFAFSEERAWANRHIAPYDASEIARLLKRRVGERSAVDTVSPGDVLEIEGRTVARVVAGSPLAAPAPRRRRLTWEPIDTSTLRGVEDSADREWLKSALFNLLHGEVLPWVQAHLDARTGLFDAYRDYQTVWQCVVHAGGGERMAHAVDFRNVAPLCCEDRTHPDANVFTHVSGFDLLQVLCGHCGPEVFWMAGGYRIYEKILFVENGRFHGPPVEGWPLFERLPDPLTHYLRKVRRDTTPR